MLAAPDTQHPNPEADEADGVRQGEEAACSPVASSPTFAPTIVTVPVPPSVNQMFKNLPGRGRAKTKRYKEWSAEAGWRLRAQRPTPVMGEVMLILAVERSWDLADIDNRCKALLDLLVDHKVIEDDSKVVGFCVAWAPERADEARLLIYPAMSCTIQFELTADRRHGGYFLLTDAAPQLEGAA